MNLDDLLQAHTTNRFLGTACGLVAIYDTSEALWIYYEWTPQGYQRTGTTLHRPAA